MTRPTPARALAALLLAPGLASAVMLSFYGDSQCVNGSTPPVGPFYSTLCSSATGQGAALLACNSAAAPASASVGIFSDLFCTGAPADVINVTSTGCTPISNAVFGQGGFARLASTQCAPASPFFRLAVTLPNPLSPGDAPKCVGPSESVTIDGGNCAPNGLFGFSVYTKVAAAAVPAMPHAVCAFRELSTCEKAPTCLPGPVPGPDEQFHLGFAALGQCLPYNVPIPVPLPPPFPQTVQAGLLLDANPPFPPVVSPTPSAPPTPSASPTGRRCASSSCPRRSAWSSRRWSTTSSAPSRTPRSSSSSASLTC